MATRTMIQNTPEVFKRLTRHVGEHEANKAANVFLGNLVVENTETHAIVMSERGGGAYRIDKTGLQWRCDCPHHVHRGAQCKHLGAVWMDEQVYGTGTQH